MTLQPGQRVLVAGAGGFIGGHLVAALLRRGLDVVAADKKPLREWHQRHPGAVSRVLDLSRMVDCTAATAGCAHVFNLAADMGGMGFIESNKAACMLNVLINTHLLLAARDAGVQRFFYASSACVYRAACQRQADVRPLREEDAYPAEPEDGYGWEKLFSERMCRHFYEDFGLETRVARFHNVYGPHGTWCGGREKAPAAICRKVIEARDSGSGVIEIWGDGQQTRTFAWIDDCVRGILAIHEHDQIGPEPLNLGSAELVTVERLVDLVEEIAGVELERRHRLDAPLGVRGRSSDNTRFRSVFGWEPATPLAAGLARTFAWIEGEMARETPLPTRTSWQESSSAISTTGPISPARGNT